MLTDENYKRIRFLNSYKNKRTRKFVKFSAKDFIFITFSLLIGLGLGKNVFNTTKSIITPVVRAEEEKALSPIPSVSPKLSVVEETEVAEDRALRLKKFLEDKKSPLAPFASLIVEQADLYDIGWTKIVAISNMESGYCKNVPENDRFDCWGINKKTVFNSYEEGIKYVSALIGEHYRENELAGIKAKYCPSSDKCNPNWASIVASASRQILNLEQ